MLTLDEEFKGETMVTTIQVMTLVFAILTIIVIFYWRMRDKKIALYTVPAILWLLHIVVFYIADILDFIGYIHLHKLNPLLFSEWSPYLRFHGVFTVFYFSVIQSEILQNLYERIKRLWKQQTY